jgi:acyl carrier protein
MTEAEILGGVRACIAQALGIEADSIQPQQRLIADLGADSLDLLDLTFQLEKRFHVNISPRDIEKRGRARLNGQPWDIDGVLTAAALAEVRAALPEVPVAELPEGLKAESLPRLFRVQTFVSLVARLIEEQKMGEQSSSAAERPALPATGERLA